MIQGISQKNKDLSPERTSKKQPSITQLWQKGQPIRLRKLNSVNTVQNSGAPALTGKATLIESRYLNLGWNKHLDIMNCVESDVLREIIRTPLEEKHSVPKTGLISKSPAAYNKEVKTKFVPHQPVYKPDRVDKAASIDSETSISSTETTDDSILDFIVNDSASEDELRRPPPSMRKSDKGPLIRPIRNQRRIVSDDEEEAEDIMILTEAKATMELTDKLKDLTVTNSLILSPKITYNRTPRQTDSQSSHDLFIHIPEPEVSRKGLSSYNLLTKPPQSRLQSTSKSNMEEVQPHNGTFWARDPINNDTNISLPNKTYTIKTSSKPNVFLPPRSSQSGNISNSQSHIPALIQARRDFEAEKYTLATEFLAELDRTITNGQIAALTKSTGGVQIVWSRTLKSVAGRASCRNETIKTTDQTTKPATKIPIRVRKATIELAASILDNEEKLLNVLAHEFCHVANMLVSNVWKQPHGKSFKEWGAKVSSRFVHKNIHVKRTHSYAIDYKYIWACTGCGYRYKRHSKRIHPGRHVCRKCKSKLVQIKPAPTSTTDPRDKKDTKLSPYNNYVKKWFSSVKQEYPNWKAMDIMTELAKRYKVEKQSHNKLQMQNSDQELGCLDTPETEIIVVSSDDESEDSDMDDLDECMEDMDVC